MICRILTVISPCSWQTGTSPKTDSFCAELRPPSTCAQPPHYRTPDPSPDYDLLCIHYNRAVVDDGDIEDDDDDDNAEDDDQIPTTTS